MSVTSFITVLIALLSLVAAWAKCVHDTPKSSEGLNRMLGPHLGRVRWYGWAIATAIVALTAVNLVLADRTQDQLDSRLAELRKATLDVQTTSHEQQRSLSDSIARLGTVKVGVDSLTRQTDILQQTTIDASRTLTAVSKQTEILNQTTSEASRTITAVSKQTEALNQTTSNASRTITAVSKQAEILNETTADATRMLTAITNQLEEEHKASLKKQLEFIKRIDAANLKAEEIKTILVEYTDDEIKTQGAFSTITASRNAMHSYLQEISGLISSQGAIMSKGDLRRMVKMYSTLSQIGLSTIRDTVGPTRFDNLMLVSSKDFDQLYGGIPDDNWPSGKSLCEFVVSDMRRLDIQVQAKCDLLIMGMHQDRLKALQEKQNLATMQVTQPNTPNAAANGE